MGEAVASLSGKNIEKAMKDINEPSLREETYRDLLGSLHTANMRQKDERFQAVGGEIRAMQEQWRDAGAQRFRFAHEAPPPVNRAQRLRIPEPQAWMITTVKDKDDAFGS